MQSTLMTWQQSWPLLLFIIAALYLPGCLLVAALGNRKPIFVTALGPVASIALAGIDGVLFQPLGISWSWRSYGLSAVTLIAAILLARQLFKHFRTSDGVGREPSTLPKNVEEPRFRLGHFLPAVIGTALAACNIGIRLMHASPSPDQVTQNYDSVFHYNVVARIALTGQASSLHALPPIREIYPIAFQEFAAMGALAYSPATAVSAVTCTWLVFAALIWPISMLFLIRTLLGRHAWSDLLAPVLASCCAGFPFLLLDWGTLYSMFAGQVILPVFIALTWSWCTDGWQESHRSVVGLAWILLSVVAVSFCHFRVMMTGALLVLPLILSWLIRAGRRLAKTNKHRFRVAAGVLTAGFLVVLAIGLKIFHNLYLRGPARKISDHLNGGPAQPTEDLPSAIARFLLGQPIDSGNHRLPVYWPLALALILALIVLCLHHSRKDMILVFSFLLLGLVFVACAGTHADWAKILTALWYKDQRRLFSAWPVVAIPIMGMALEHGLGALKRYTPQAEKMVSMPAMMLAATVAVLICAVNPQLDSMQKTLGSTYAFAANDADAPMLSTDEFLLMKRMGRHVSTSEQVLSDPWNGSGYMLAVGGTTPFYAHLNMNWDHDHAYLATNFEHIDSDPQVCRILTDHHIDWYADMGGPYVANDPQHQIFNGLHPVPQALQLVDSQGRAKLYRITACRP